MAIKQRVLQGQKGPPESFFIFVPRRTIECDEMLANMQNYMPQTCTLPPFNPTDHVFYVALDLVQIEQDLLSLELPNNFAHFMLRDDDTYKVYVQSSIKRIESVFG